MNHLSASTRDLARRLLDQQRGLARAGSTSKPGVQDARRGAVEAAEVCEKLHATLSKLSGPVGVHALLRRALTLARADIPELKHVEIAADGRVEGLAKLSAGERDSEAAVALIAHLLSLLVTLIGEPLTVIMLREGWPEIDAGLDYKSDDEGRQP